MSTQYRKIAIGITVLAVGLSAYFLLRKPKSKTMNQAQNNGGYLDSSDAVNNPYFNPKQVAGELYRLMNEYTLDGGTDESGIFDLLRGLSQAQFAKVFKAFGNRNYNALLGRDAPLGKMRNLKHWLKEELSSSDYNVLKSEFPKYLN